MWEERGEIIGIDFKRITKNTPHKFREGGNKLVFSNKDIICIFFSNSNYINFCNTNFTKTQSWTNRKR